jgi:hypothetical protein
MHRSHFDYEIEDRVIGENALEDDLDEKYQKDFDEETKPGIVLEPAKDHSDWKWTILWEGFKALDDYRRRSNYCDPERFRMYIYNDFSGYGLMKLMESTVRGRSECVAVA